jgi:hypothetical protein
MLDEVGLMLFYLPIHLPTFVHVMHMRINNMNWEHDSGVILVSLYSSRTYTKVMLCSMQLSTT